MTLKNIVFHGQRVLVEALDQEWQRVERELKRLSLEERNELRDTCQDLIDSIEIVNLTEEIDQ